MNLTLAAQTVNRHQKSGKDAGEWMPRMNRCWFAGRVVAVKRKYGLTIDGREAQPLEGVLSGACRPRWSWPKKQAQVAEPMGQQREWTDYVPRGSRTRHRTSAPGASGLSVHAGWGWGRSGV